MHNLLYVEDDRRSQEVVRMALRLVPGQFSAAIFEHSENFEARLLALDPQPDLILLDIHVKPYSGFDMLRIIRSLPQYDSISVVALTASVMSEEIQLLRSAGFHSLIAKPLNLEEFPDQIQQILAGEVLWHVW